MLKNEHGFFKKRARKRRAKMDEEKSLYYLKKIAPTQKEFKSEAAKKGERISPTWMPDDIGTKGFDKNSGTSYLRKMQ